MAALTRFRPLATIVVLCTIASPSLALDPDRTLAQLHHTAWTAEDGAPSQVSAIAQTADGYLWIGSARGLFRFDGVEFERYLPPNGASLPSHNTYALCPTPEGGLWISFRPSGLGLLERGQFTSFVRPDEIPPTQVYVLVCDFDGRVFAGAHDGLFVREGTRWVLVGSDWNLPPHRVQTLFVDRDGTLWIAAGGQIHSLRRGARLFVYERPLEWARKMSQSPDGRIWLNGLDHVASIPDSRPDPGHEPYLHLPATELLVDRDGCLWIATPDTGVRRVRNPNDLAGDVLSDDPRLEWFREADGLSDDAVRVMFEDREGNIWVGTGTGIDRFRHNHFVPVSLPDGYDAFTLLPGENGSLWVATGKGKPLLHVSASAQRSFDGVMSVVSAYREGEGRIWWGSVDRIVRQERESFRSYPLFPTADQERLWEVFRSDVKGALWVSVGDMGLYHFHDGVWERRPPPAGLPERGPSASFHAPDGRIWLGYTENRVCVLEGDTVLAYTQADGIDIGRVRVIRGRADRIWVGGELGLALFDGGRFRTVACVGPEPFGTVSGIVDNAAEGLWLNEVHGVVHIPGTEVAQVVRNPAHSVRFRLYDVHEGLPGAGQMNFNCSTATETSDGKLWFATDGGLAWIDPRRIATNSVPPPVVIRSIVTEDGTFDPADGIRLANDTATLRIDYTALSLTNPKRVRYRYKLEGYDEQWIEAGTRRVAFYTRLQPGPYRFRVGASNNDGVWNTVGASAAFSIAPAFYQTRWFTASAAIAILCTLWFAYRWRVRQVASRLQRLHDERIDERMRIAHELHDTLLQGFLSASMQLHVVRDGIPADASANQQVGHVLTLMDNVIGDARNAVRGLRTEESVELEQAFTHIPHEVGANGQGELRVVVNGRLQPLQPTARDEVYRIGRESIMNAFRHSHARSIEAEINYLPRELRVIVRDDGRGIDANILQTGRDGHWGLSGMRERAKRMGARFAVRSRVGYGTEIELVVPGRIAFISAPSSNRFRRAARRLRLRVSNARKEE